MLSPFSFDLCFSSLSSFHYRSRSLCSSVIILWQISFDHRKSKERCITILAPLPILNDDHLCSSTYYQLKSIINYRRVFKKMINTIHSVYFTYVENRFESGLEGHFSTLIDVRSNRLAIRTKLVKKVNSIQLLSDLS